MRRRIYAGEAEHAVALFERARYVHLAGCGEDGAPILRALHGVVVGDRLCFHAANAGEKLGLVGRAVVAMAQEIVAEIPSHFIDPALACPATTYYRSAQARGLLEPIDCLDTKAAVLEALMRRFQPEGGYDPIVADDRRYAPVLRGLLVAGIPLHCAVAKIKLGQDRRPAQMLAVLGGLWRRGTPEDIHAIELLQDAYPELPPPAFLRAPGGTTLSCGPAGNDDLTAAADLLAGAYWNAAVSRQTTMAAHESSAAWVGARDPEGKLVATARAVSDRATYAYIADVIVDPAYRGRGVATAVTQLLLDHPAVRGVARILLRTRDAQPLYGRFGFVPLPGAGSGIAEMQLRRARPEESTTS